MGRYEEEDWPFSPIADKEEGRFLGVYWHVSWTRQSATIAPSSAYPQRNSQGCVSCHKHVKDFLCRVRGPRVPYAPSNRARHAKVDETSKRTKQYFWVITWKTSRSRGSAILSTKGSEVMSPVPVPSTLFGLHATDQTSAESPFAGPTQFAYGAPHEMRMKDPYPAPHQPTVSNPEYRRTHNLSF